MGRPRRCSSSPCVKNSAMHISVHARLSCRGLAGFAMSAVCRASPMAKRASFRVRVGVRVGVKVTLPSSAISRCSIPWTTCCVTCQ